MICGNLKWRSQSDSNQRMSDLQSEALPALLQLQKIMIFLCIYFYKKEWQRTRDSNPRRLSPRRFSKPVQSTNSVNPLQLNGANGENRTHTPKPERDFKSRASTYSATLAQNLRTFLSFHLNWTGIIVAFFLFVKSFLKKFKNFNFYTI